MNILIFSWRGPGHPNFGGAEISTHEHAKGWVNRGHKVTLFTSFFPGAKKEETIDGVKIIRKGFEIFGVQLQAIKWYLFENKEKFDIVIDQFHGIPFFTPFYVRNKKLGFIHEVAKEVWSLNHWPKPYNLIPSVIGTFFEPFIFRFIYKNITFMTVSNSTKEDLIAWGIKDSKITVVHNGIDIPKNIKPNGKAKTPTAIFLGAISRDKGIEEALRVFSLISKQEKDWKFQIVGKAEKNYLTTLKLLRDRLKIKNVSFFGFVDEKKKFELLSKAHILINTSVREGWGLVIIEAAAMGTPSISFDVPGLRDSIINGKTGILSKKGSRALSDEVISLMKDKKRYEELKKNCIFFSKRFSWEKSVYQSLKLIEKMVKI